MTQAVRYWQRAGQRALQRSAHLEAIGHLTKKSEEVLAALPDTPARIQQELELQTTLGPALVATKGFASPEVLHVYTRARALCQQAGKTPQVFQVLRGLWYFYLIRSDLRTALELGERLPHPGPAGRRPRPRRGGALCPRAHLQLSRQVR